MKLTTIIWSFWCMFRFMFLQDVSKRCFHCVPSIVSKMCSHDMFLAIALSMFLKCFQNMFPAGVYSRYQNKAGFPMMFPMMFPMFAATLPRNPLCFLLRSDRYPSWTRTLGRHNGRKRHLPSQGWRTFHHICKCVQWTHQMVFFDGP